MQTLTEKIRQYKGGVVDNPYQGKDKRVLFVCSAGILRSATAARIYANKYNTRACGSMHDIALVPFTLKLAAWADEIVFVNKENYEMVSQEHPGIECLNVRVLDIPDKYPHMDERLIQCFKDQYEDF